MTATQISTLFNFGTPETNISFSPVHHWKLNDINTGLNDTGSLASNNAVRGAVTGSGPTTGSTSVATVPSWKIPSALPIATPNYTTALDFVSSESDYIDCGDSDSFSFGDGATDSPFSISAWVNMADATNFITIAKDANSGREYVIRTLSDDKLYFYLLDNINGGYVGRISSGTVTSNQSTWIHTSYTYNGNSSSSGIKIYLNGSQVDNANYEGGSYTAMSNTSTNLNIGRQERGLNYGSGPISNVAIFNSTLTASQVSTLYNGGTPETAISFSPVSWWKLDTGGSTITDYGSGGNNGTNNGAALVSSDVITPQPVNGVSTTLPSTALQQSDLQFDSPYSNYSLSFDNANATYIDCGTSIGDSLGTYTGDLTISLWLNTNSTSNNRGVFYIGNFNNVAGELQFNLYQNELIIRVDGDGNNATKKIPYTSTYSWNHLVFVYKTGDIGNSKIYLNGVDTTTTDSNSFPSSLSLTGLKTIIGSYYGSSYSLDGKIDETSMFNYSLSEAQVLEIYNNGKPGNLDNFSGTAPINWWRLGENAYFVNNNITLPNSISGAPNGVSSGTATSMLSADAPGTYANGIGDGLAITDRVGDAPLSVANSQSYNMIPDDKVPYVPGYVGAQTTNAFEMTFDGTNYFDLSTGLKSTFSATTKASVSLWFNAASISPTVPGILFQQESTDAGDNWLFVIRFSTTGQLQTGIKVGSSYPIATYATGLNTGDWYNVVSVYDGSTLKLYLNGAKVAENSSTGSPLATPSSSAKAMIGATAVPSRYFNGQIDEVAIFDEALTADQVKFDLYEPTALVGGVEKTADIENNTNLPTPVAWYRMGD